VLVLALLGIGVVCALISRFLLFSAAAKISSWWAMGILLPFGPLFFRLNYREQAQPSIYFRYATVVCLGAYLALGGPKSTTALSYYKPRMFKPSRPRPNEPVGYALEKRAPTPAPTPSIEERRAANTAEFERLNKWGEELRIRKRDLLHSDVEGNRQYNADLALYNAAVAKATAERNAIPPRK
jgi:hypothetical protein